MSYWRIDDLSDNSKVILSKAIFLFILFFFSINIYLSCDSEDCREFYPTAWKKNNYKEIVIYPTSHQQDSIVINSEMDVMYLSDLLLKSSQSKYQYKRSFKNSYRIKVSFKDKTSFDLLDLYEKDSLLAFIEAECNQYTNYSLSLKYLDSLYQSNSLN